MATMKQDKEVLIKRTNTIDVRKDVWESGIMSIAISNMKKKGLSKSDAVRISGCPYEIVDRYYRGDEPARKGEKDD
jgi:hypothetical protein